METIDLIPENYKTIMSLIAQEQFRLMGAGVENKAAWSQAVANVSECIRPQMDADSFRVYYMEHIHMGGRPGRPAGSKNGKPNGNGKAKAKVEIVNYNAMSAQKRFNLFCKLYDLVPPMPGMRILLGLNSMTNANKLWEDPEVRGFKRERLPDGYYRITNRADEKSEKIAELEGKFTAILEEQAAVRAKHEAEIAAVLAELNELKK